MAHTATIYSEDKQYKADLHAFHDWWFFYAQIGCTVNVYRMQKTKDTWGHTTTDWVAAAGSISISNVYGGSIAKSPNPPTSPPAPPQSGGGPTFTITEVFRGSSATLREWATGFLDINITGAPSAGAPVLDISAVVSTVVVEVGGAALRGQVEASNVLTENSVW